MTQKKIIFVLISGLLINVCPTNLVAAQQIPDDLIPIEPAYAWEKRQDDIIVSIKQYEAIKERPSKTNKKKKLKSFYPLELTIENRSSVPITIDPENISLQLTNCATIAGYSYAHNALASLCFMKGIVTGICAVSGSVIIAGSIWGAGENGLGLALIGIAMGFGLAVTLGTLILATPAMIGYKYYEYYSHNSLLQAVTLHQPLVINPDNEITKFIFVQSRDCKPNFTLTIQKGSQADSIFAVDLNQ